MQGSISVVVGNLVSAGARAESQIVVTSTKFPR